jgi:hypothetical protein
VRRAARPGIRREFPAADGKPTRYCITLAVQTEDGLQRPERWSDTPSPSDIPARGDRTRGEEF